MLATLSPDAVLQRLPSASHYWLAYSGGSDSTVLLDLLGKIQTQLPGKLTAIHINHGVQAMANDWAEHCRVQCRLRQITCVVETVTVTEKSQGPEAAARDARYAVFEQKMQPGEVLLTAHHQDDQAETVLLRLLRGAGVTGLAAIRDSRPCGAGQLCRPLLRYSKTQLQAYAVTEKLRWVDDNSNIDTRYARNVIRQQIMPLLQQRWPAAVARLTTTAAHCAQADTLLQDLARLDLQAVATARADALNLSPVLALSVPRRNNLLRYWFGSLGFAVPPETKLVEINARFLTARDDRNPMVTWSNVTVRRYRQQVYALPPLPPEPADWQLAWDGVAPLVLPEGYGQLLPVSKQPLDLRVMFRQGGERFQPVGCTQRRALKTFLQEQGVPPWERARLPLILCGGEIYAVADRWRSAAAATTPFMPVQWLRDEKL